MLCMNLMVWQSLGILCSALCTKSFGVSEMNTGCIIPYFVLFGSFVRPKTSSGAALTRRTAFFFLFRFSDFGHHGGNKKTQPIFLVLNVFGRLSVPFTHSRHTREGNVWKSKEVNLVRARLSLSLFPSHTQQHIHRSHC